MAQGGPDKELVIEAIVLAFSYSELSSVVGKEALESVLRVEYHDMVADRAMDMSVLWELLEEQPGFSAEAAVPPLAQVYSWREKLDLEIELPAAMSEMSDKDLALAASRCNVPPAEIRVLLRLATGETLRPPEGRSKRDSVAPEANVSGSHEPTVPAARKRPAWLGIVAIVVAIGTFGFAGATLYGSCGDPSPSFEALSPAMVADLPATDVDRLGSQVRVTVEPAGWRKLAPEDREKRLKTALMKLEGRGIAAISVRQGDRVVATAAKGKRGSVKVWQRP